MKPAVRNPSGIICLTGQTVKRLTVCFAFTAIMLAPARLWAGDVQHEFLHIVRPMLERYCGDCHAGAAAEAGFSIDSLKSESLFRDDLAQWDSVLRNVSSRVMPPPDADQPSRTQRTQLAGWIRSGFTEVNHRSDWDAKLVHPEYGNYADHRTLFEDSVDEPAWSPARLWKKSPQIFDSMLHRGMGLGTGRYGQVHSRLAKVKQPFTIEEKAGIRDFADVLVADSATLGTLMRNAEVIVDQLIAGAVFERNEQINGPTPEENWPKDNRGKPQRPSFAKTPEEFRTIIFSDAPPTPEQAGSAVRRMFDLVVERSPNDDTVHRYVALMQDSISTSSNTEGLRITLVAVAISPEAVYRSELGQGPPDSHGRQLLSSADLAFAISYALTDTRPDEVLLTAVRSGRLRTSEDVATQAARIWDDTEIEKPRVLRFFREFFGYAAAPGVFKDDARFGSNYTQIKVAELLVTDADVLVQHIVDNDRNVLAELLTTERYFVAHSGDNEEHLRLNKVLWEFYHYLKDKGWKDFPYKTPEEHMQKIRSIDRMFTHANGNVCRRWMSYLTMCDRNGMDPIPWNNKREYIAAYNLNEKTFNYPVSQPFVLDQGRRAGLLMHPAWLIAHSLNLDNDPIRRGKWIRERLLADTVPELPITVDAAIPEAPEQTLRQRLQVTQQAECWKCHQQMNPLGMPFESFDDFGRHRRDIEQLHAEKQTAVVDSSGRLTGSGDPNLDGDVEDAIELVHRLAKSNRVRQSFVRHAFRYFMGRNEMLSDSSTLIAADKAYVENGGSFRALVLSLLTSDSFLYRKDSSATRTEAAVTPDAPDVTQDTE